MLNACLAMSFLTWSIGDCSRSGYLLQKAGKGGQQIEGDVDERLKNIDVKMIELITNEVEHLLLPLDFHFNPHPPQLKF